jgi:hypothetical protein
MSDNPNTTTTSTTESQNATEEANQIIDFEAWLAKAEEPVQKAYAEHVTGLKSALTKERDNVTGLNNQLKAMAKKAEKGSELEQTLLDFTTKLDAAEKRADFMEDAVKPEIGCRNPKAAWVLAVADDLFTKTGSPDWRSIQLAAPELFGKIVPKSKGGNGTDETPPPAATMNDIIRNMAK